MPHIDMPMDYHVRDAMLVHYQRLMPKLANIIPSWNTILSTIQNDLLHIFDKAIVSFYNSFRSCVAETGGHWHWEKSV